MIKEEKREYQKKIEQIYQIVNDLKNKIRQFEEKLKDIDINFFEIIPDYLALEL